MSEAQESQANTHPIEKLHPPMHPWQTVLLCVATLTLYVHFCLYRHARDVSIVDTEPRKRWLWFLSPVLSGSLLFSIPRLFKRIDTVIGEPRWHKHALAIAAVIVAGNLLGSVMEKVEMSDWLYTLAVVAAILLISLPFGYVQAAGNDLKQGLATGEFTSPPYAYTVAQWLALIFGGLTLLAVIAILLYPTANDAEPIESYPNKSVYHSEKFGFELTMHGDGWKQVEIGTFSDGSAVAEFNGISNDHYLLVFIKDQDDSLDSQLEYRQDEMRKNESSRIRCNNTRTIDESSMTIIGTFDCTGRTTPGEHLRELSYVREVGELRIETLGRISAPKLTAKAREDDLVATVKSLKASPQNNPEVHSARPVTIE